MLIEMRGKVPEGQRAGVGVKWLDKRVRGNGWFIVVSGKDKLLGVGCQ